MRALLFMLMSVTAAGAAIAGEAPRNDAYTSLTARDAAACARACADDGICMAWRLYRDNACALSAVVPAAVDADALASGFAPRAPSFLQRATPFVHHPSATEPQPEASLASEHEDVAAAAPEDDSVLLGGPDEAALRLR